MRVQLSLFPMDLYSPSASEPASEVVIAPEQAKVETMLSLLIAHEPQAEELSQVTAEMDDCTANETIGLLPCSIALEEDEQQPATVLPAVVPVIPPENSLISFSKRIGQIRWTWRIA